ncbi:MAG: EAL domain-containing protein [Pseudomonadota bacterium]|nr:EAL domain-containing protein [Pseudomonadota bacterium]
MSLIRQIWLLLLGTLVVALVASVTVTAGAARDALQTQLRMKNSDNATAIAQVLSQQKGQPDLMAMVASAQFDTGFYHLIRVVDPGGKILYSREESAAPRRAPGWFVAWFPISAEPGIAQVSDGWRALGRVEVVSQTAYAHDELWRGSQRAVAVLAVVGVIAGLLATLAIGRIRRPLEETVQQAASLQRGEYVTLAEPDVPELRRLTRAMNSMVSRLRVVFEGQAAQVESLRRQASCDALTGLANRGQFMAQLGAALQREDGTAAGGVVLLRVVDLAELNRTLGHARVDAVIVAVGDTLRAWSGRVAGAFVGRLNGSDFGLVLAEGGVSEACATAILGSLREVLADVGAGVAVVASAVETRHGAPLASVLGAADLALAQAESAGPFSVRAGASALGTWAALGQHGWREQVRDALADGRARLATFPVVDRSQRLIHLECPLRLQLQPDGPFETAAQWLPLAVRSRLTTATDERALALALEDIAHDGQPRGVNLSPASLADSAFAGRLRTLLQTRPREARMIWLEVGEIAAAEQFERVRELARQVRPTGARFGLEHAGERLARIDRLFEAGLDYVKIDAATAHGVHADANRAGFVKGLVTMLHSLSLQVFVEGVVDEGDAQVLWEAGVDGITGPWAQLAATA